MSEATKRKRATSGDSRDAGARARRKVLDEMGKMTPAEAFALAVRAGIYTRDGKLTRPYRDDAGPSASRPTD